MALKIMQKNVAPEAVQSVAPEAEVEESQTTTFAEQETLDQYIELYKLLNNEEMAQRAAKAADLLKKLKAYVADSGNEPTQKVVLTASDGSLVEFSGETKKTTITDPAAAKDMLGPDAFYAICKPGITDLKKYLTPAQFDSISEVGLSGSRTTKVVIK